MCKQRLCNYLFRNYINSVLEVVCVGNEEEEKKNYSKLFSIRVND